jgi:hypothetical protein
LPKHPTTPLASSQINHDQLSVELVEPDGMPAMVRIVWPPQPTIVPTVRFPETAAAIARLFATAATTLAGIKARRRHADSVAPGAAAPGAQARSRIHGHRGASSIGG